MTNLFSAISALPFDPTSAQGATIIAFIAGLFIFFLILALVLYIYLSLAYMAIARKAKQSMPGLAWIPFVGTLIIAYRASKMHWWPWVLLAAAFLPVIGFASMIIFTVYATIWQWKMFKAIRRPGWWALLCLIPIVNIILIGIAAWSKK